MGGGLGHGNASSHGSRWLVAPRRRWPCRLPAAFDAGAASFPVPRGEPQRPWASSWPAAFRGATRRSTASCPRPLLPVAHQPLISYALRWLAPGGVRESSVCLNPASRRAQRGRSRDPAPTGLEFYEDAASRAGPRGARATPPWPRDAETFVVADGTAIPTVAAGRPAGRAPDARARWPRWSCSRSSAASARARCLSRPGGVYVFERRALEPVPARGFQDIKENLIPRLYRAGEHVAAHAMRGARRARAEHRTPTSTRTTGRCRGC